MTATFHTIVKQVIKNTHSTNEDILAVEAPLEIRLSFEKDYFYECKRHEESKP